MEFYLVNFRTNRTANYVKEFERNIGTEERTEYVKSYNNQIIIYYHFTYLFICDSHYVLSSFIIIMHDAISRYVYVHWTRNEKNNESSILFPCE